MSSEVGGTKSSRYADRMELHDELPLNASAEEHGPGARTVLRRRP